jgi:hypothetical protein
MVDVQVAFCLLKPRLVLIREFESRRVLTAEDRRQVCRRLTGLTGESSATTRSPNPYLLARTFFFFFPDALAAFTAFFSAFSAFLALRMAA